ncbi:MAG: efflux RND transporter periplasmic adaptor subunit [Planctomycetota bacterium]|jgi:RND family efflux transporter MFP subunit
MKPKVKAIAAVGLKTVLPLVVGLAVLVLVIAWLAGVFEEKIQAEDRDLRGREATPEEVENAYTVQERFKYYVEEVVGTLKAAERTEISARILAPIKEIRVRARTFVKKGDLLIVLDSRVLEDRLSQAENVVTANEAAWKRADGDYRRTVTLYQKKVASRADYDQATEAVNVARANLERAQKALSEAQVQLRPGEPLLLLYDPSSLRLEVPVMENLAVDLKEGDELDVYIDALKENVKGRIDEIVPQADAVSRSFLVKVAVPQSDDLYENMFGRLRILPGKRRHLCLHTGAIKTVGQLQFVEVIKPDDRKELRLIKTGRMGDANHVEVLSGLEKGERVVMRSLQNAAGNSPSETQAQREQDDE